MLRNETLDIKCDNEARQSIFTLNEFFMKIEGGINIFALIGLLVFFVKKKNESEMSTFVNVSKAISIPLIVHLVYHIHMFILYMHYVYSSHIQKSRS